METIRRLEEKLDKKFIKKARIQKEITELTNKIRELKSPYKIGDIVDYEGNRFQIIGHEAYWPLGKRIKKDGNLAKNETRLYDLK